MHISEIAVCNKSQIITPCQENFGFRLSNELISSRSMKLETSYCHLEYKFQIVYFLLLYLSLFVYLSLLLLLPLYGNKDFQISEVYINFV